MGAFFSIAHCCRGDLRALRLPQLPRWISEHQVEAAFGHAGLGRVARDLGERKFGEAHRLRDRGGVGRELGADTLIHTRRSDGTAAERFESVGAGASEKVEHRGAGDERRE